MKLETVLAAKGPAVFTIAPEASLLQAVETLAANNVGAVIVVDGSGRPVGVLSERDIVRELTRNGGTLPSQDVATLMTKSIRTGSLQDEVNAVLVTMTAGHFRHLPVVEDGQLLGVVTTADLVKAQLDQLEGAVETLQLQLMSDQA